MREMDHLRMDFLESMGIVKTARKEADSIILARVLLRNEPLAFNSEKFVELAKLNKVLLRTAHQLKIPAPVTRAARVVVRAIRSNADIKVRSDFSRQT